MAPPPVDKPCQNQKRSFVGRGLSPRRLEKYLQQPYLSYAQLLSLRPYHTNVVSNAMRHPCSQDQGKDRRKGHASQFPLKSAYVNFHAPRRSLPTLKYIRTTYLPLIRTYAVLNTEHATGSIAIEEQGHDNNASYQSAESKDVPQTFCHLRSNPGNTADATAKRQSSRQQELRTPINQPVLLVFSVLTPAAYTSSDGFTGDCSGASREGRCLCVS